MCAFVLLFVVVFFFAEALDTMLLMCALCGRECVQLFVVVLCIIWLAKFVCLCVALKHSSTGQVIYLTLSHFSVCLTVTVSELCVWCSSSKYHKRLSGLLIGDYK